MLKIKEHNSWFYRCYIVKMNSFTSQFSSESGKISKNKNISPDSTNNKPDKLLKKENPEKKNKVLETFENTSYEVTINIKFEMNGDIYLKVGEKEEYKLIYSEDSTKKVENYSFKKKAIKVKEELNLVVTKTEKIIDTLQKK
jgi:hypothetical protein